MRNPLNKRYLRDLRSDLGKYLVIFLLLLIFIGEMSGYLVASESMALAYSDSFEKYNIEDGHFTTEKKLTSRQKEAILKAGARIYDLQYKDVEMTNGTRIRLFRTRDQVNLVCLMEGKMPESPDEIAIDRMYAENNSLRPGDTLTVSADEGDGKTYVISGLVALSDYSALFENNNDMMFDAKEFSVSVITAEAFSLFDPDELIWQYAWKYTEPVTNDNESERSDEFVKALSSIIPLNDYVPEYVNQAIIFAGDDITSDNGMMKLFMYIVMVILAFVFAVTASNTITKESTVIGTLRASGYTRAELIRHYMFLPVAVTLAAALIGNVLGYTFMKNLNADLYYGSYSLPTYVTVWSVQAFLETTLSPVVIMVVINWLILSRKLRLSPLKFLRKDLKGGKNRGTIPLSSRIRFMARFRLRIFFQNVSSYAVLFAGILFADFLLLFGLMLPAVLNNYMDSVHGNMLSEYQYILSIPAGAIDEDKKVESLVNMMKFMHGVETENETAEKFSAWSLRTLPGSGFKEEDILLYGVQDDSRFVQIDTDENKVYASSAFAVKWKLKEGDRVILKDPYGDDRYEFLISGIYNYDGALALFMGQDLLNEVFELGDGTFTGYFSDTQITDIDPKYIGRVIDLPALTKVSRQLNISFGEMMQIVDVFAIVMYVILIYLLGKVIIEKNAKNISMTKILGYTNREIAGLYVMVTTILVLIFLLVSLPLDAWAMKAAFGAIIRSEMAGWIPFDLDNMVFVRMIIYGVVTYAVVALLEYIKIGRTPMNAALKDAE